MTKAVISAHVRPLLDGRLPDWLEPLWFASTEELLAFAPAAEIGWFDSFEFAAATRAAELATDLRWLNTLAAGVEVFPLDRLRERGVLFSNGAGLNAPAIAEYALLGMLVIAKGYRDVVRAQERHEWLTEAPGKLELSGSRALIIGAGGIGGRVADLLQPFGVDVVSVRRRPAPGALSPDEWRGRLAEFDWVIVATPSTPDTAGLIGDAELRAMKPTAAVLNFARGAVIDQDALIAALREGRIGAAFLDVADPEPLPPDNPLWDFDNVHISMHLSGRSQTSLFARAADRFVENLERFRSGEPLIGQVDLTLGY